MTVDTKKWFDVPDSKTRNPDGEGYFYNVEARFADHPILDVEASRKARHNVYFYGPVLHTRVKRSFDDVTRAITNATSHVMRFDKGRDETTIVPGVGPLGNTVASRVGKSGMSKEDFERAVRDIRRCFEAWQHYQLFRKSIPTELEKEALGMPIRNIGRLAVDRDGKIMDVIGVEDEIDEDDTDFVPPEGSEIIERQSSVTSDSEEIADVEKPAVAARRGRPPKTVSA